MDVSGEAADVLVKEGLQITETSAKLLATGLKHVAALLLALQRGDYKIEGETNSKRLARDPTPPVVMPLRRGDMDAFRQAAKEYGILYFFAPPRGRETEWVDVVSSESYTAKINAAFQSLGYPLPDQMQEDPAAKKASARAPQENSSRERGNGLTPSRTRDIDDPPQKESVKRRLEMLKAASKGVRSAPERTREQER